MKPVYGNVFAVYEPDPPKRETIATRLAKRWPDAAVSRPAEGWLLAVAPIGSAAEPAVAGEGHWTVAFAEHSTARDRKTIPMLGSITREPLSAMSVPAGDVTVIALHGDGRLMRAVRSCAGTVPVYIARQGGRIAVSTLMEPLVRCALDRVEIDAAALGAWATGFGWFPEGRTWIRDVSVLEAGDAVQFDTAGRTVRWTYWQPRPERIRYPNPEIVREHVGRFRGAVLRTLEHTLDPEGRNLLTLSGGVDSTVLAYLTARTLGVPLSTLTFESPAPAEREADRAVVEAFAAAHPPRHQWFHPVTIEGRLEAVAAATPMVVPVPHPALQMLPKIAAAQPVRVLFGGEFADHVSGSRHHLRDWAEQTSLWRLADGPLPEGPRDVARWLRHRLVRSARVAEPPQTSGFLRRDIRAEVAALAEAWRLRTAADPLAWRHLAARMRLEDGVTPMNWEAASASGVLRVFPFLSRDTLEVAYASHAAELIGPGYKKPIRRAFADDVPPEVLAKRKYAGPRVDHPSAAVRIGPLTMEFLDPAIAERTEHPGMQAVQIGLLDKVVGAILGGASSESGQSGTAGVTRSGS